jgi:selenocysteine-specific elongation factor
MSAHPIILGTAGHIDHGKTALVKALTGIDTDRLKEEQQRGITIELGFAHLSLGERRFGLVDVPGHERFIKSMVAGAAGIDLVMLVVAADEGVMPQTREHLDICHLLGVKRGLIALTKKDLVEPDWLALVVADLEKTLEGTFLEGAPILPCSSVTGEGLDAIRATLEELTRGIEPRDARGLLRLPLDRVFTMKGFGTVVTGTLLSGSIALGDDVVVLPQGLETKVRGLQVHGEPQERAVAGQRTAVNLGGVERHLLERGEVLAHPRTLSASPIVDVALSLLPGPRRGLPVRSRVLFHIGTRQQEGSCILLGTGRLEPGGASLAQLRFEQPVVALPNDRFILRGFAKQENYGTTIGGGHVVRVLARKVRPRDADAIVILGRMDAAEPEERVALELLDAGAAGLTRAELQERLPMVPSAIDRHLARLLDRREAIRFARDSGAVIHRTPFELLRERTLAIVDEFHRSHPFEAGISREELRSRLPGQVEPRLFAAILSASDLVVEKDTCRRTGHEVKKAARPIRPLADRLHRLYLEAGLGPPWEADLPSAVPGEDAGSIAAAIRLLLDEGALVRVGPLLFAKQPLEQLRGRLVELLEREGQIDAQRYKELVGQSRKYVIPLAEHFDAQRVTLRVGEVRKLRR